VSVENGVLTIAAERQESNREKLEKGYRSEFRYGSFVRQVRLPAGTSAGRYSGWWWHCQCRQRRAAEARERRSPHGR
jgi:hypothetical protein